MAWLAAVATVFTAGSQLKQGEAIQAQQKYAALMDERDANASQVEAQQMANTERKRARYLRSRALSVAGASGAGVSDPTVVNILSEIDTEGELRALNSIYEGDYAASGLRANASARRRMGRAAKQSGTMAAIGTTVSGGQSFFEKYG